MDLIDALKYPFSDMKKLVVLALVNVFWFFFLPLFLVNGYLVRIIRGTLKGEDTLPSTEGIKHMFVQGAILTAILIIFLIIPILISYVGFNTSGMDTALVFDANEIPGSTPLGGILLTISAVLLLVVFTMIPMIMLIYSASEDIKTAFNIRLIFEKIMLNPLGYVRSYLFFIVMFTVGLLFLPITGIFSGAIMAIPMIFGMRLFSKEFRGLM